MPFYAPELKSVLTPFLLPGIIAALYSTAFAAVPAPPLITSSVKLRIDSNSGHEWGTGTIIDTRQGPDGQEALILTCGHVFQDWGPHFSAELHGRRNFEVHLYGENSTVVVYGRCLYYDLDVDLALVTIAPPAPVRAVPIAPEGYQIQPSQQAWSVGCDHGGNPTVQTHQVMSVDRFFKAQDNRALFHYVQVSGAPVGGRSGGGLFSAEGYLIGVCNTGDPVVNDGHFVPPQVIRHVLTKILPEHVYQNLALGEPARQAPPPMALAALTPLAPLTPMDTMPNTLPNTLPNTPPMAMAATPAPIFANNQGGISQVEQATLEEVERRKQDGDEVIVIFHSRNPGTPSDVIVLNGTSNQFRNALVNSPAQPSNPSYNSIIFSSDTPVRTTGPQPVSFSVKH